MIELDGVSAGYGGADVIKNISLTIKKGRLISIIGANGAGKSTLIKAAAGLLPIRTGRITVSGRQLCAMTRQEAARMTAYLSQGRSIPDMSVEQLVLHGRFPHLSYPRRYREKDRAAALGAMRRMGIEDIAHRPLASLSGGMRQNAYIAMALTQDTEFILLDEPTTYLDISNQLRLMRTLRQLADGGRGIAVVMHDLPLAFTYSDDIALLDGGELSVCGPPREVCESGIIGDALGAQLICSAEDGHYFYRYER